MIIVDLIILLQQHQKFPAGKEIKGVGESRGRVRLTQFMNSIGMRKSVETHGVRRKYDLEAFIVAMHNCRR